MISDTDHFALLKTIKGIKDNVDKMYTLGNDELQYMRDEFLGYLKQLVDVVNGLHSEKEELTDATS
jgi:UV DNA damage repair endonuclease